MLIGVLSDSHGRAAMTAEAVRVLRERGAELLIHLGDFETDAVIDELAVMPGAVRIVFGNCDWSATAMADYARRLDIAVDHPMGEVTLDGKTITFTHGHLTRLMDDALRRGVDYLLHGHTHEPRDERIGHTRIINPGALHRARRYTVALLDSSADRVEFIEVPKPSRPTSP